jgi:hypothetical protein
MTKIMSSQLKTFHYLVTGIQTWGRGHTVQEAFKNASIKIAEKKIHCILHTLILKEETTDEQLDAIVPCFVVNDFGGLQRAYDCTEDDNKLIDECVVGWSVTHYNKPKKK